jgi:hypothetical protein
MSARVRICSLFHALAKNSRSATFFKLPHFWHFDVKTSITFKCMEKDWILLLQLQKRAGRTSYGQTCLFNKGLTTEFCSEKIPRNRLGTFPLFRGRKCSFRGIPRSTEESISKLGTEISFLKKKTIINTM